MSPNHDDAVKQATLSTCYDATARAWKASPMKSIYLRYSRLLRTRSVFHIASAVVSQIQIEPPEVFSDWHLSSDHRRANQRRLLIPGQT